MPQFKDGRHSRDLPSRLAGRYREALEDEDLLQLADDIALVTVRIGELLGGLDKPGGAVAWARIEKDLDAYTAALKARDMTGAEALLLSIQETVKRVAGDKEIWGEIVDLIERRRRLVETQRRALVDAQQVISAAQAMIMISALVGIVREHVSDRGILAAIADDVDRLIGAGETS